MGEDIAQPHSNRGLKEPLEVIWSNPLLKQVHSEAASQDNVEMALNTSMEGDSVTSMDNLLQFTFTGKNVTLCLGGPSSVSICAHCLLFCHWASLRRIWLHLLCTLPSVIHIP